MGRLLPTGRGASRNLVKQHQLLLSGSQAGGRRLLLVLLRSVRSLGCSRGRATIKHQSSKGSRVQFPACLLVSIYHTDQFGPVFLLSSIWQNERNYRKSVFWLGLVLMILSHTGSSLRNVAVCSHLGLMRHPDFCWSGGGSSGNVCLSWRVLLIVLGRLLQPPFLQPETAPTVKKEGWRAGGEDGITAGELFVA